MSEPWRGGESEDEGRSHETPEDDVFGVVDSAIMDADDRNTAFLVDRPDLSATVSAIRQWARDAVASADSLRPAPGIHAVQFEDLHLPIPARARGQVVRGSMIRPFVQVELARQGHRRMINAEDRLPALLDLLVDVPLTVRAEQYVGRVAKLYLWGFDAEVAAVSRAALESVLKSLITDDQVKQLLHGRQPPIPNLRSHRHFTLWHRLEAAKLAAGPGGFPLLHGETVDLARQLREAGNDFLHESDGPPELAVNPLRASLHIIESLARVLAQLLR